MFYTSITYNRKITLSCVKHEHDYIKNIEQQQQDADSGLVDVLVVVAQLPRQLVHHLLEDDGVNVHAEHVEEEPVSHLGLLDDDVNALLLYQPEPYVQQVSLDKIML